MAVALSQDRALPLPVDELRRELLEFSEFLARVGRSMTPGPHFESSRPLPMQNLQYERHAMDIKQLLKMGGEMILCDLNTYEQRSFAALLRSKHLPYGADDILGMADFLFKVADRVADRDTVEQSHRTDFDGWFTKATSLWFLASRIVVAVWNGFKALHKRGVLVSVGVVLVALACALGASYVAYFITKTLAPAVTIFATVFFGIPTLWEKLKPAKQ